MDANYIQKDGHNKFEVYESGQYREEILIKGGRRGEETRDWEGFDFRRTARRNQELFFDTSCPDKHTHTLPLSLRQIYSLRTKLMHSSYSGKRQPCGCRDNQSTLWFAKKLPASAARLPPACLFWRTKRKHFDP